MKHHMTRLEEVVAAVGAAHDGIVSTRLLAAVGIRTSQLGPLRRRAVLQRVGDGVYRLRDHPWTWRSRLRAALELAGPGAVVCRRSAARLHGFYAYRETSDVEVLVVRRRHPRADEGRCIQTRKLPASHVTEVDGFPVTTIARTFFDLCGDPDDGLSVNHPLHEKRMARVYNDAAGRRGLRFAHEVAVLVALARRGRAGTRLVRRLLERFGADYQPTMSETEYLFAEMLEEHRVPKPERQVKLSGEEGFIGVVDFYWPSARLVVEIDCAWHDGPLDEEIDDDRDERLRAAGYDVVRYRYRDLVFRSAEVIRELVTKLA